MKKLITKNLFIDTSLFIGNLYGANDKFKQLAKFASNGLVNIWLSEVIIKELRKNVEQDFNASKNLINECNKKLNSKARILKIIEEYKPYFELPRINIELDIKRINDTIDLFINQSKAQIIPHNLASINEIVDNYFAGQFPFNKGDKKHEFPDAIVISSIESWCISNKCKIYLLSLDNDILNYKSKNIIPTKDFSGILDNLTHDFESREKLEKLNSLYLEYKSQIIDKIEDEFKKELDSSFFDFELQDLYISSIELSRYDITYLSESEAELEVFSTIDFMAVFEYNDYSSAIHDNEDDVWYNVELITKKIEKKTMFPVTITFDLNPPAGKHFANIKSIQLDNPGDLIYEELE